MGRKGSHQTVPHKKASQKDKGKAPARSSRSRKMSQKSVVIDNRRAPARYGVRLSDPEAEARWAKMCLLDHKHCRYLHMPTIQALGIAENLLTLTDALGLTRLFTANWLAYRGLTLEFLSTVGVDKIRGTPFRFCFQLGNEPRELTVD